MNSPPQRSLRRRCTGHQHTGRYQCSHWGTFGCCSLRQWSVGSTHISHPRSGPCHYSCLDMSAGCSRLLCSPRGTHTSHRHIGRCRCTRQGRTTWSNLGLPTLDHRGSCRCHVGRCRGHCSLCPNLQKRHTGVCWTRIHCTVGRGPYSSLSVNSLCWLRFSSFRFHF